MKLWITHNPLLNFKLTPVRKAQPGGQRASLIGAIYEAPPVANSPFVDVPQVIMVAHVEFGYETTDNTIETCTRKLKLMAAAPLMLKALQAEQLRRGWQYGDRLPAADDPAYTPFIGPMQDGDTLFRRWSTFFDCVDRLRNEALEAATTEPK